MSRESELLRQQLEYMRVDQDAENVARKAAETETKDTIDRKSEPALLQARVQGQQVEQGYRSHPGTSFHAAKRHVVI